MNLLCKLITEKMSLIDKLKHSEAVFLSGKDIHQITKGACNPMAYHELENVTDIEQLFNKHDAVMLLYESEENSGHWVTLIKHSDSILEFFDPYGLTIDKELKLSKYNLRLHQGQVVPHLTHLIEQSKYKVISNTTRLQRFFNAVNTCGRHCAVRVLLRDTPLKEYVALYKKTKHYDPDIWVTALTITYSL